jgi:sugar O-acyltransferase (sialic acid O-acetyltransferase NeuD family)
MSDGVIVIGGGGHGKVVVSTLLSSGVTVTGIYDDDKERWGKEILKCRILGPLSMIESIGCAYAVAAVGDNLLRSRIVSRFEKLNWVRAIHPAAYVHPSAVIGAGTVVFAGAVIQPDALIGEHCIINSAATIDHDCIIGDYVHIAPGVKLAGNVKVEEGAFLGIGSAAIVGITVGKWTIVGAGGVIIEDLPSKAIAVGVPAKAIKHRDNVNQR